MRPEGHFYLLDPKTGKFRHIKNTITEDGATLILRDVFRKENVLPADSYWLGLTNADYTFSSADLVDIAAGEPTGNGYARQELPRDMGTWSLSTVSDIVRAQSALVQFTADSQWDIDWTRAFICDAETGTAGTVFGLSKAIEAQQVLAGQGPAMKYEFWMRP